MALLLEGQPFGDLLNAELEDAFQPCRNCDKPCIRACPALAFDGQGGYAQRTCAHWRHRGGCGDGCGVRHACPVGAEHAYTPEEDRARQACSLTGLRRLHGLGAWRLVPSFLR